MTITVLPVGMDSAHETEEAKANVLVVYHSRTGNTRAMAEAVARGARSVSGVRANLRNVGEARKDDVLTADAIILGSPVYNANVAPAVQEFINGWPFKGSPLKDKVGAAFVSAGGVSAGEEATQLAILRSMLVFGMVVVGGPEWTSAFGASAVAAEGPFSKTAKDDVEGLFIGKAEALGRRVAQLSLRMNTCGLRECS